MKSAAVFLLGVILMSSLCAGEYSIRQLKLNKADGIYKCGEKITVSGRVMKKGTAVDEEILVCRIKWEGKIVKTLKIPCRKKPFRVSYSNNKPGWVYFEFRLQDKNGKEIKNPAVRVAQRNKARYLLAEIGAMYEPEKIRSTAPVPEDFKEFWQKQLAELAKVPMAPVLEEIKSGVEGVKLYKIALACTGGRPATAYLAYPENAKPGSCPGFVDYLSWSWCDANRRLAVRQAKKGVIAIAATWHGLPVGQSAEYYKRGGKEFEIAKLRHANLATPEKWFFTGMYMRVKRVLDFLKSRPEWNGKELVVQGGSLGGAETAFAAAFDPAVTLAVISVPGFCEFNGAVDGRKRSIPFNSNRKFTAAEFRGGSYGDTVNLCRLIKCETIFCTGFADELCPPSNAYAAYNNLPAGVKKAITTNPYTGHYGTTKNIKGEERLMKFFNAVTVRNYPE